MKYIARCDSLKTRRVRVGGNKYSHNSKLHIMKIIIVSLHKSYTELFIKPIKPSTFLGGGDVFGDSRPVLL